MQHARLQVSTQCFVLLFSLVHICWCSGNNEVLVMEPGASALNNLLLSLLSCWPIYTFILNVALYLLHRRLRSQSNFQGFGSYSYYYKCLQPRVFAFPSNINSLFLLITYYPLPISVNFVPSMFLLFVSAKIFYFVSQVILQQIRTKSGLDLYY